MQLANCESTGSRFRRGATFARGNLAAWAIPIPGEFKQSWSFSEQKCYGHKNELDEAEVKRLFDELNVKALCEEEEIAVYKRIVDMIKGLRSDIPQKPFFYLLNTIYKRNK